MRYKFPILETPRLVLREPRRGDAQPLLTAWSDAESVRYFGTGPLATKSQALEELRGFRNQTMSGEGIRWILTERDRDEYIGDVGFFDFAPEHSRAEIGFLLARPHWGRGYMSEALDAVLEYGFTVARLHRVEALVDPRNSACLQLLERKGFQREGLLRDYEFEHDTFIDLAILSLLPEGGTQGDDREGGPQA